MISKLGNGFYPVVLAKLSGVRSVSTFNYLRKSYKKTISGVKKKHMKKFDIYGLAFGLLGFGILIWFFISLIPEHLNINYPISVEKAAQIGDFVGGVVATLFSIAAFLLLYETLNMQKSEIKENQGIMQKQAFESNLFQMINMHNDFVKEFDIQSGKIIEDIGGIRGGAIITIGRDSFNYVYTNYMKKNIIRSRVTAREYIKNEIFDVLFNIWRDDLNHYFKHSCEIVTYIYKSSYGKYDTKYFMNLFASGLSDSEKALFFYYILFYGNTELKSIIKEFDFFYDLPEEKLIDKIHKNWIYE